MEFKVLTDEELKAQRFFLEEGMANFTVMNAENAVSKTGNEMIKLTLRVIDKEGKEGTIFDYLVSTEKAVFKIKQFCDAIEKPEIYKSGKMNDLECLDQSGKCILKIRKSNEYGDQVIIKEYLSSTEEFIDDEIPF